ncbi:MAG: glycosyltransferase family 2 protein [Oscillospiraceae bacterium]|nr:glycosyltransferase family 2 protein [Oscillospiraceae bacterium]
MIKSLRQFGFRTTCLRIESRLRGEGKIKTIAERELFSDKELKQQRAARFPREISFSIAAPLYNTPEHFLRAMIESVLAQTYAGWELCMADGSDAEHAYVERVCREYAGKDSRVRYRKLEKNFGISGNSNACLEMAAGDYISLLDHDDLLHPAALYEVMRAICEKDADFVYTDESTFHKTPRDAYLPHFKPAFAPDNLRANNYICHFTVFRRALLDEVGLFDPACDGSQDHDLVLRLTEKARRVAHIPEILYYWRAHAGSVAQETGVKPYVIAAGVRAVEKQLERLGLQGEVSPVKPGLTIYRTRYAIKGTPKVSVLIPNCEHLEDLRTCIDSVLQKTTWPNYEIVIVENNSSSPALFAYYEQLQQERSNVRVHTWKGEFNYSAINNFGAQFCSGEYLLLLNNDTEIITPDWIQEMLMFAQRPDVGAVGAKLYYPDGTIQHAGVILGIGGVAAHAFQHVERAHLGYMGRLLYAQDVSAVTAACMLLRREVWEKTNGLDEGLAVAYNDVDLCMRIRQAGYLVIWTPFAELYHAESKSRGLEDTPEKQKRFNEEVQFIYRRWEKELGAGDPYYHPNFSLHRPDFYVEAPVLKHDAR